MGEAPVGLDIYVGPMTRYYSGDWKLITQQAAEAAGLEFEVVRQHEPSADAITDPRAVHEAVLAWRGLLERANGPDFPSLAWNDAPQADYFTDKPDWDGYWAVRFLAARDEFPDVPAPARIEVPSKMRDPSREPLQRRVDELYRGKSSGGLVSRFTRRGSAPPDVKAPRYPHLHLPEFWLPADFDPPVAGTDLAGVAMTFGSIARLLAELELLNDRTLRGNASDFVEWGNAGPPEDDRSLESVARFGLSVLLRAARYGVEHDLPMKMDY
jgi:hypothetical protein